jgi:hypothetical protein
MWRWEFDAHLPYVPSPPALITGRPAPVAVLLPRLHHRAASTVGTRSNDGNTATGAAGHTAPCGGDALEWVRGSGAMPAQSSAQRVRHTGGLGGRRQHHAQRCRGDDAEAAAGVHDCAVLRLMITHPHIPTHAHTHTHTNTHRWKRHWMWPSATWPPLLPLWCARR